MQTTSSQQGFFDATELKASITPTHLYTFDSLADNECRLGEISQVEKKTIASRLAVIAIVPGRERHPAARFADHDEARRCHDALVQAVEDYHHSEQTIQAEGMSEFFGEPISIYTRQQALDDGVLVDVTGTAREAGIVVHTAITAALDADISDLSGSQSETGQSYEGRLWDAIFVVAVEGRKHTESQFNYKIEMPVGSESLYEIKAVIGPGDDGDPVLTLMKPDED